MARTDVLRVRGPQIVCNVQLCNIVDYGQDSTMHNNKLLKLPVCVLLLKR